MERRCNQTMNIYKCYDEGGIEKLGKYDEKTFPALLFRAVESLGGNDLGIGISRTEEDFIEIRPVGKDQYLLWSDRLHRHGSVLSRLFQDTNIQQTIKGKSQVMKIVRQVHEKTSKSDTRNQKQSSA